MRIPLIFLATGLSASLANAATFTYTDFSSISGLTLNGDAAQAGSVLRLVPNVTSQAGNAFLTSPIALDATTSFTTSFQFLVTTDPGDPTDGFSFLLQNQDVNALGGAGQGSGYVGISPSVAVLFRGRGPAFVGVITNGIDPLPSTPPDATTVAENAFYNQNEFAWIDYNPSTTTIDVFLNTSSVKPGSPIMSTTVDVFGTLGSQAYVGFGAGTGGASGDNDIINWSFSSPVPEPTAAGLIGLGVALRMLRRSRTAEEK